MRSSQAGNGDFVTVAVTSTPADRRSDQGPYQRCTAGLAAAALALTLATAGPAAAADDWGTLDRIGHSRLQA